MVGVIVNLVVFMLMINGFVLLKIGLMVCFMGFILVMSVLV